MSDGDDQNLIAMERRRSRKIVQSTLAVLSLCSLLLALAISGLADHFDIPDESARAMAASFVVSAIVDASVLYLWEPIFSS